MPSLTPSYDGDPPLFSLLPVRSRYPLPSDLLFSIDCFVNQSQDLLLISPWLSNKDSSFHELALSPYQLKLVFDLT
jgi:hypothetical protein